MIRVPYFYNLGNLFNLLSNLRNLCNLFNLWSNLRNLCNLVNLRFRRQVMPGAAGPKDSPFSEPKAAVIKMYTTVQIVCQGVKK
jgi:hypothetical protein